jgi:hypothetical protein
MWHHVYDIIRGLGGVAVYLPTINGENPLSGQWEEKYAPAIKEFLEQCQKAYGVEHERFTTPFGNSALKEHVLDPLTEAKPEDKGASWAGRIGDAPNAAIMLG